MITASELETLFPAINWRHPITVQWPGGQRFACRICIAQKGLNKVSDHQWKSYSEAVAHLAAEHPISSTAP